MPRRYNTNELIKFALQLGFIFVSQRGSHRKYKHPDGRVCIIPQKNKPIPIGTTMSIVQQLGIAFKELSTFFEK